MGVKETEAVKRFMKKANLEAEITVLAFANFLNKEQLKCDDIFKGVALNVGDK